MAETKTIADQIAQIKTDRDSIRGAMKNMGIAGDTDKLGTLATKLNDVTIFKNTEYDVKQAETFAIPKGYHDGSTKVTGLDNEAADAYKYKLTSVSGITPKEGQTVTQTVPSGFYGMSSVTVDPIPENFKDTSSVTATQADVLIDKLFVTRQGLKYGTMPNNGAVSKTLDLSKGSTGQYTNNEYTVPQGYHNGGGKVKVVLEDPITLTPDKSKHDIVPSSGKMLSTVTVQPIPSEYQDVSGVTATAETTLKGSSFVDKTGTTVNGTIETKGYSDLIASGATVSVPAGYYDDAVSKSVTTIGRAQTAINTSANTEKTVITITAKNEQGTGYVTANSAKDTAAVQVVQSVDGKKVYAWVGDGDSPIEAQVGDGAYSASVSFTQGLGSVSATGTNVTLTKVASKPSAGFYITATGSGKVNAQATATVGTAGWLEKGSASSDVGVGTSSTATSYYTLPATTVPATINPLTQTNVTVTEGYTTGATISVSGELLTALQEI